MGCGTLDWADLFDHVAELLPEEEDAPLRDHLASCDACRADSGELMVLSEGFWALGILTHVTGREEFADAARAEVREVMGDGAAARSTSSWRAISAAESQRARRLRHRRAEEIKRAFKIAAASVGFLALVVWALFTFDAVAYLVDTSGEAIEDTLGMDLADWGLRRTHEDVAKLAVGKQKIEGIRELGAPVWRLLLRELSSTSCRPDAVVRLEFAHTLVLNEKVLLEETDAAREGEFGCIRDLIASAVREAGRAEKPAEPPRAGYLKVLLGVLRKARARWVSGDVEAAQELLLVPVTAGEPLALYYSGIRLADSQGWEKGSPQLLLAAEKLPAVWAEVAWRLLADGKSDEARGALEKAPADDVRKALEALVTKRSR